MMLLQASDWQFLITTQSARDYAEQRFSYHHSDFNKLCDIAEKFIVTGLINHQDFLFLEDTEKRNSPFPELKLEWWR
jgi:1,4-alpha-glucan branching enzyme